MVSDMHTRSVLMHPKGVRAAASTLTVFGVLSVCSSPLPLSWHQHQLRDIALEDSIQLGMIMRQEMAMETTLSTVSCWVHINLHQGLDNNEHAKF